MKESKLLAELYREATPDKKRNKKKCNHETDMGSIMYAYDRMIWQCIKCKKCFSKKIKPESEYMKISSDLSGEPEVTRFGEKA